MTEKAEADAELREIDQTVARLDNLVKNSKV